MIRCPVPLLGFCAWSGTGKTTLLTRLIPLLRAQRLRIAVLKHAHHGFDIDQPGKDSWALRKAGAEQTIVASRRRIALIHERSGDEEPRLAELLDRLDLRSIDLVLVEGFKQEIFPKIELHRPSMQRPLLCGRMRHIIAVAADEPLDLPRPLPLLALNQPAEIADFIRSFCDDEQLRLSL